MVTIMRMPEYIATNEVRAPAGHYSQGAASDTLVFVSGQLPVTSDGSQLNEAGFEEQARQALTNVIAILRAAGSSPAQTLKVTAYIVGVERWASFNRVFSELFGDARPARTVVPVTELHHGYLVEVDAIAMREKRS
jgi:2-iminobutanoate/2-iminopropanoate deaminase